jgi:hypothetical protein
VRTYSGTALGGTTPEANFLWIGPANGLDDDDVARIDGQHRLERCAEMSDVDVCGLGIRVYSAAVAFGNASADKSKLQIDSAPILAIQLG